MSKSKRQIALDRADTLLSRITDYLEVLPAIPKGRERSEEIRLRQAAIRRFFGATETQWNDYRWQLSHRITRVEDLVRLLPLSEAEADAVREAGTRFRWAVSPYYLSLITPGDPFDPIRLQALPTRLELADADGDLDPMGEEYTNPAGCITRRYPDRLILNVTNVCAMFCRHCQRRRNIGQVDKAVSQTTLDESIAYVRNHPEIRDILVTGGDPLTMSDSSLEKILKALREIPHVELIRIGTRTPVTMPQRITPELCGMLQKYHPLYVNTHFNHPMEITEEAAAACARLADAGIPLGNQSVLLNGVNNDKFVMRCLNQELLKCRVKPYYLFHAKTVKGTSHFHTSIEDGLTILEYLRGYTTGMAIPAYVVNAPLGKGKTPLLPQYLLSRDEGSITFRTWEGEIIHYPDEPTSDFRSLPLF